METTAATVGLDIGGTKILGVVVDEKGEILAEGRRESPHGGIEGLIETSAAIVAALDPTGAPVGVGIAGLVDDEGRLSYGPNMPGLVDAPVRAALAEASGRPVAVDNDANVAALAEITYGAAAGARNALMVTLGTGIGGGIVMDGRVYRGAHGFAAEIGHFTVERGGPKCACGAAGHWEAIASGSALGRMARELAAEGRAAAILAAAGGDPAQVKGDHVGEAARAGDAEALMLLERYADNVALGLAALANILDPERIVISGGLVLLGSLLFDPLQAAFLHHLEGTEYRPRIPLLAAVLGERAGAIGAAVLGRDLLPGAAGR